MIARFVNAAPGTTTLPIRHATIGNPPPAYPPAGLDQPRRAADQRRQRDDAGVQRDVRAGAARRLGIRRLPDGAVSRDAGPDAALRQGRLRSGAALPARLHRPDPLVLGIGLAATRDIVAFFRGAAADEARHAEPGGRRDPPRRRDRRLAVGQLHPDASSISASTRALTGARSGTARSRASPRGRRRSTCASACPAAPPRCSRPGSEPAIWWGALRGSDARAGPRQPARSLHRVAAPVRRSSRRSARRSSGACACRRIWSAPTRGPTSRCRPTCAATTIRARRTAAAAAASRVEAGRAAAGGCTLPANPNPQADTTRALTRALVDWVVARHGAAARAATRALARGELVPPKTVAAAFARIPGAPRSGAAAEPGARLRLRSGSRAERPDRRARAAPPRVRQVLPTLVPRVGPDGNELDGVPSVLHQAPLGTYLGWNAVRRRLLQGSGLRLQRRLRAVRADAGRA